MTRRANAGKEAALLLPGPCEGNAAAPKGQSRRHSEEESPAEAPSLSAEAQKGLFPHVGRVTKEDGNNGGNTREPTVKPYTIWSFIVTGREESEPNCKVHCNPLLLHAARRTQGGR